MPAEILLTGLTRRLLERRPELSRRLGAVSRVPVAVVPDDMPHAFLLSLDPQDPSVKICAKDSAAAAQAVVRAPLLVLLGLLDGTYDGDALFFSRDLRIEGRTEYVLALRNTLEEADLNPGEFLGLTGRPAQLINGIGNGLLSRARAFAGKSAYRGHEV